MSEFPHNNSADYHLSKKVYLVILISGFVWLLLIFLAPLLSHPGAGSENLSSYLYLFFSKVCHQQDDRSFHLFEYKLGVCSRCVWIYAGFFLGTVIYRIKYKVNNINPPAIWLLIASVMLLISDVIFESLGVFSNTFFSRSLTGFIIGLVLPFYLIPGFVKFFDEVNSFLRKKVST